MVKQVEPVQIIVQPIGIILRRLNYDDSMWRLELFASNGSFSGRTEFYCYEADVVGLSDELLEFPDQPSREVRWECGVPKSSDYLLLRFHLTDSLGHAAIEVEIDDRSFDTVPQHARFLIATEVAAVNRLGQSLKTRLGAIGGEVCWITYPGGEEQP